MFELPELLVQQIVGLVDEADEDVRYHFGRTRLDIGPIGLIGPIPLGAEPADEPRFLAVLIPELEVPRSEEVVVISSNSSRLARATLMSFISPSFEVPETWLPSRIFCFPERAACTIWSTVRSRLFINRSQKQTVASKTTLAF